MEIRLIQHVNVNPLAEVAAIANVAASWIELPTDARRDATLNAQPIRVIRHVINTGNRGPHPLLDEICAEWRGLPEELGNVWTSCAAGRVAAKQSLHGDLAALFWPAKVGQG